MNALDNSTLSFGGCVRQCHDVAVDTWTTIPQLIDDATHRYAKSDALIDGDLRLSYDELRGRIREAARALMASDVEHGDRVAIWAPNIWEWVDRGAGGAQRRRCSHPDQHPFQGSRGEVHPRPVGRQAAVHGRRVPRHQLRGMLAEAGGVARSPRSSILRGDRPPMAPHRSASSSLAATASTMTSGRARAAAVTGDDLCPHPVHLGHHRRAQGRHVGPRGPCVGPTPTSPRSIGLREGDRYLVCNPFFHSFGLQAGILVLPHAGLRRSSR